MVQYDGLCVGHGGYRKCLSINCDKRALANGYCQAHGGNSMCRVTGCRKRAIRGGLCSEHKAQTPPYASGGFASCRPSIDLPETPFKVEPTELPCPRLEMMDMYSPAADEHVLSPLQYVRRGSTSHLDNARTMVTPIFKHFNAGERYDPYRPKRQNLPVLPSFQMLRRGCNFSPWLDGSEMDWSSSISSPNPAKDQKMMIPTPMQPRVDEFVVSLGRTCTHTCSVATCSRHAKQNGLCLLHSIVAAPR